LSTIAAGSQKSMATGISKLRWDDRWLLFYILAAHNERTISLVTGHQRLHLP
jgi:hypothetical protein